jgi:ABC-type oligopeptide transport system substrate-binding subunit
MLALGTAFFAVSAFASASLKKGDVFRVGTTGASVQIDPQLGYTTTAWSLEYATAAKLYNYPDSASGRLGPEVASRAIVSNGGKTYTFPIRTGFRFSDGTPVTASSFAYAIQRAMNRDLASPGAQFLSDVRRVVVRRNRLIIHLARPDGEFLAKMAMPFFQATSRTLPLTHEVTGAYPSAGPYWFTRNDVNVLTSIRRNPYYQGRRPHNIAGLDVQWNLNEQTAFEQVQANELDEGPLPAAEVAGVASRYGVNRSRFWVKPTLCVSYLAFNNERPLFGHSLALRKAVNWAVDRTDYAGQAGSYASTPWTHLLSLAFPGSVTKKRLQPYSVHANLANAKRLAGQYVLNRKITVGYRSSGTINPARAQIVRRDLIRLGFKPGNITMKPYSGADIYDAMGAHGNPLDLGVGLGWCGDYFDSYSILEFFLEPNNPQAVDSSRYRAKLEAANRLRGAARFRALGRLDVALMRNLAPAAAMQTYNNRYFFSARVDRRGLAWQPVYQDFSIPALKLK